ncbi:succinyldiaminopimelate desuccinylase [Mariprofundus ferrinatatus]|uniref:Succinyl-diaminopimelate desuccinylase n=1 Tax=Mariprofundus ferrinatatus TaxID=1921087 RepID=A0A2K8L5K8_9PROT|nr:succinyl-diaminopimelate desuccinylase [Mariprofundus ferrinatatus]ATX82567.1 succinyldiaminopimelate desuccinylase [Mariprofundus ferrinatatus]
MSEIATNIAVKLIRRESVTPDDGGCQNYIERMLAPLGFVRTSVDAGGVTNSIYTRMGELPGTLAFAGHTDVVPTGPVEKWQFDPFSGEIVDGILHGRGAQDMKSAVACWIAAVGKLCGEYTPIPTIQLLITSDEEGESVDGTIRIIERMQADGTLPDACIVGEPSCSEMVGDTIRRGRRGVVQIKATFHGKQGHSAYPQDADNAIHHAAPALAKIATIDWGTPAAGFPATSCQITNVNGGTGATNVIPGFCEALIDIRYNPANNFDGIKCTIEACCEACDVTLEFDHSAIAFSTADGPFLDLVSDSIRRVTGIETLRDTGGGTSDGRFLAAAGVPVAELGTTNSTIHQVGEQVAVSELATLTAIYTDIIENFEV